MAWAFFVLLSIVPVLTVAPASAGRTTPSYSCSVPVLYTSVSELFYLQTTITVSGGFLPSPEGDFVQAWKNGMLIDTPSTTASIPRRSTSYTFLVTTHALGAGVYSFYSEVVKLNGAGTVDRLASCWGYYNL